MYDWTFEELLDRVSFDLKQVSTIGMRHPRLNT
jgi:hypothetical protein